MQKKYKMFEGWMFALFTVFVWGVTFVNTKALLEDFSALEIQVLRFVIAAVSLWGVEKVFMRGSGADKSHSGHGLRDELLFAGMGFFGVATYQLMENCAIHYTNASNVSIIVSANPMLTALLAWGFGGARRPGGRFFTGFLVAIIGVAMVSLNGVSEFHFRPIGDMLALGAMISWGGYSILMDKMNSHGYSQIRAMRRVFEWSLLMMIPFVLYGLTDGGSQVLSGSFAVVSDPVRNIERFSKVMNFVNLGFLGFLASAACFVLWNRASSLLGVVRCTATLYLIPAVTVLFAFCFLGERLTFISAAGAVLTLIGVILSGLKT